jgi:hypothetical protein
MPNITTSITIQPTISSLDSLINSPNNAYNQALGSLPDVPPPPPPSTDVVIETDTTTDFVFTTDTTTDFVFTTDTTTDFVFTTDTTTDFVFTTDTTTDVVVPPLDTDVSALDYTVWAAAWQRDVNVNADSVVPMIWVDPMGGWGGPGTTDVFTDDVVSSTKYNEFKTTLLNVPEGRRVIQPTFWAAVPPNLNWSPLTFIDYYTALDGTTFDGRNISWTPWQENIIDDAKTSFNQFLGRCKADGLTFNYITDNTYYGDGGAPNIWNLSKPPVSDRDAYKIYVSTTGDDNWTGLFPYTTGTNGPVKTIKKASELARNYTGNKNVEIQIRQGTYRMLGTDANPIFYLNESNSGKEGKYITYRPYKNETVVISGAEEISHSAFTLVNSSDPKWSRISAEARGNVYVADISGYDIGPGIPSMWNGGNTGGDVGNVQDMPALPELIFNGKTMTVARWPNKTSLNSNGYTFGESAVISTVVSSGTSGVWCVDPTYLGSNVDLLTDGPADDASCYCGSGAPYNANCFQNATFTYSSDYDSVISTWSSDAINDGIWLHGFWRWDWADEVYKVVSINTGSRTITVASKNSQYAVQNYSLCNPTTGALDLTGTYLSNPTPRRWFALNILEELDTPGEYYIDRANKKLYFWPTEAISASSEIRITHRAVAGPGARNNNSFEVGYQANGQPSRTCPECFPYKGWEDTNYGWYQPGGAFQSRHVYNSKNTLKSLFKLYKTKNIIIEGLTFRDSAGSGIELNLCENVIVRKCKIFNVKKDGINAMGGKNVTIDSCTLYDIGRTAIINTGGNRQTLEPANKLVTKCSIKRWNRNKYNYAAAIILNGCGNTASYNLMSDGSAGILIYGANLTVEYNHLHNLIGETDDAGGIYAGRNAAFINNIIRYNFLNNVKTNLPGGYYYSNSTVPSGCVTAENKNTAGTHGVYFDDLMSNCSVIGNVFYQVGGGEGCAVYFNGGVKNTVNNNLFIDCNRAYGAAVSTKGYWNNHLNDSRIAIVNNLNYPWYETGGPLGSDGKETSVSGYSPYTWYGSGNGHVAWVNNSLAGIMPVVDITAPIYQQTCPQLFQMISVNASKVATIVEDAVQFKNNTNNNVIINTPSDSDRLGINTISGETWSQAIYGGFNVGSQLIEDTNTVITFAERASLNFKLSASDLATIRASLPTFEDIAFEKIPTLSYVPESYTQQTYSNCAVDNRHYTCERDFSDPDALEAIVTDSRFTSTVNPVNGKTLSQDFMDRYNAIITKTNSMDRSLYTNHSSSWYVSPIATAYNVLSPNFGYIVDVGEPFRMQQFPWTNSSTDAATRAWTGVTFDWGIYYRTTLFKQPLVNNGYSNVKYSIDYSYALNAQEAQYVQDQYGGWQGDVREDYPDALYTPPLYGELETGMFNRYTYAINPSNDDQKYLMGFVWENQDLPQGYLRFTSPTWVAFLRDMKLLRAIIRSNPDAWQKLTPWIPSPDGGDVSGSRMRYSRSQGETALQFWKEMIFHACLHGTQHFNYWNSGATSTVGTTNTLELHNILEEWRQRSGNSRAQPVTNSRIAVNSSVIISGGRLLSSNKYLWRVTAKPSSSVTLRAYGNSLDRTDIPQTITLNNNSRGAWLLTDSSVPPTYVLDEGGQQEDVELKYITLMRADNQPLIHRARALFGGASHDYGSGIGFDQNGKSLSALQYIYNTGITWSGHQVGNLNWYYASNYKLDSNGNAIPVVVRTTPTTSITHCNNACYSGVACFQVPGIPSIMFTKYMSETGEWGAAMRPSDPFPNGAGGSFNFITINDVVFTKQPTDNTKPLDYSFSYYGNSTNSSGIPYSFWARTPAQNGRNDLAYDYTWQGTVQLRSGHEHVIPQYNLSVKLRQSSDGDHTKNEPGNIWKYKGFVFAPIRQDDGCADHLFVDQYKLLLNTYKQDEEYKYFVMNLPSVPSCIVQSETWKSLVAEEFVNGAYKPKEIFVNYEEELVDQIRCLNITGRTGPNNYGRVSGQPLTNEIWERLVSYIKLTRKMNYHIRSVFGPQVKISHYDMFNLPYYQEWKNGWYPAKDGLMWSPDYYTDRDNGCPFCSELDIDYPGDVAYAALPLEQKLVFIRKAVEALQSKTFKMGAAISKMCLFENVEGQPDVLDLRQELSELLPQIDPNLFIIEGLNHYPNSAHGEICNNVHKYYAATPNGFNEAADVNFKNNSEINKSRQQSIHHKEQARVGMFNNQRSGKLYSWFVQGVCGSDVAEAMYEYYNSNLKDNAGFVKSWTDTSFAATEVSSFPSTETDPNHLAGERIYKVKFAPKNTLRRSFLKHMPWINMTNDFLNRSQIATTIKYKDEVIWSDNNLASVIMTNLNGIASEPKEYRTVEYNLRPCAQGETPSSNCRDIVANPYIKPKLIEDNFKLRNNNFDTFSCSSGTAIVGTNKSPNCVDYCYVDPVVHGAGSTSYPITSLLRARRHMYGLAVEYAGYDDMVAIPLEDFANDIYWGGYLGATGGFDPFITTPPATVSAAQALDRPGWPHIRGSETAKRAQGLGLILAARKDYSIYKYIKNPTQTNVRDWPQPAANFNVDRRPGIAATITVSGGPGAEVVMGYSGTNTNRAEFFKKCLDGSGNPIPNVGFQKLIDTYFTWNYDKGVRRFMIWTPGGTVYHTYPNGERPAVYTSAITSSMERKIYEIYQVAQDGVTTVINKIVNPAEACWRNITTPVDVFPTDGQVNTLLIPATVAEAESYPLCSDSDWDGTSPCFDPEGRKNEVLTCMEQWIDSHPDADVGVYMGYTIPTLNGEPETGAPTIIGDVGAGGWLQNAGDAVCCEPECSFSLLSDASNGLPANNQSRKLLVNGNTIYSVNSGSNGLSISTNGGATYVTRTTANGLGSNTINDIFVVGNNVYAATNSGLSISTDGGQTFINKSGGSSGLGGTNSAHVATVSGVFAKNNTIYAAVQFVGGPTGTQKGLGISTDGGNTFTMRTSTNSGLGGGGNGSACNTVFVGTDNKIYVGTATGGLGISTDGGNTFTMNNFGAQLVNVQRIKQLNNKLYVISETKIGISTDGGQTFTIIRTSTAPGIIVGGLFGDIAPVTNDIFYASTSTGLYKTINSGQSFTKIDFGYNGLSPTSNSSTIEIHNNLLYIASSVGGGIRVGTNCLPVPSIRGWQIPNPENNPAHGAFLQSEIQPWIDIGINFLGMDVGVGMFNYQYGGALSFGANPVSREPVGDYKQWLQTTFPTLKTIINEAIQPDWKAPVLDEFNKPVVGRTYPRKTLLKTDRTKEVCKGVLVSSETLGGEPWNTVYTDDCWHNKGRERFRKLDPAGKDYRTAQDPNNFVYAPGAYQYSAYMILLNGNLNSSEWNIGLHSSANTIQGWGGLDPNKMWCWYRKNTEIGLFVETFYLLSKTMRDAYRLQNPNEVDAAGNNTYNNLWQFTPAWHDKGISTPTPTPSGVASWDGRNILRDSDTYNKVRNEMFVEVKNYIERGYVYWSSLGKDAFQVLKDVHSDLLSYVAGYESDDNIFPEDEITENRATVLSDDVKNNIIISTVSTKDNETLLATIINSEEETETTDSGTDGSGLEVLGELEPGPAKFGGSEFREPA